MEPRERIFVALDTPDPEQARRLVRQLSRREPAQLLVDRYRQPVRRARVTGLGRLQDLREVFEKHGTVESVAVISDRETGRSRGFAFVEMDDAGADAAMRAIDGNEMGGRSLRVNEAHERGSGGGGARGGPGGPGGGGGDRR